MCDACDRRIDRRRMLRAAATTAGALAASQLSIGGRSLSGSAFADDEDSFESAAMAEERPSFTSSPSGASAASGTVTVRTPNASSSSASRGVSAQALAPNANALGAPPIASRAVWGANESLRVDDRAFAPIRKLVVHHSASDNNPRNPADVVRFIQRYHSSTRGFSDTGYNYLIDHKGGIYEGRAARRYRNGEVITDEDERGWGVVGAHAKGVNAGSCGVCLIGNFDNGSPTDAAIASLVWLLSWKASRHRIDAKGSDPFVDIYGFHREFPNISGHRQVGSTVCPGKRLFELLPTIRNEVGRRAGQWQSQTIDMASVWRRESGPLRTSSGGSVSTGTPKPSTSSGGSASSGSSNSGDPGNGSSLRGYRVISANGRVFTTGSGRSHGNLTGAIVALANSTRGDGYWALDRNGGVHGFGGVGMFGDAAGKGPAADLAVTGSGRGYWILMSNGGIYPFGNAGYASSPKRAGFGGTALRMAARPAGDGYWVLMSNNVVRAFGNAPRLGAPDASSGSAVDIWPTPSGRGYWVLTDRGVVAPFGDAGDFGDLKRSRFSWSKKATHLLGTPSGRGYLIVSSEGGMLAFGDAPALPSFAGSGMTAVGVAGAYS